MPAENARLRRYAVIVLVGGLHGLILFIMLTPHGSPERPDDVDVSIAMTLYFPPPVELPTPASRNRRPKAAVAAALSVPAAPESMAPVARPAPVGDARPSVDWIAEAETMASSYAAKHGAVDAGPGIATSATSPRPFGRVRRSPLS